MASTTPRFNTTTLRDNNVQCTAKKRSVHLNPTAITIETTVFLFCSWRVNLQKVLILRGRMVEHSSPQDELYEIYRDPKLVKRVKNPMRHTKPLLDVSKAADAL